MGIVCRKCGNCISDTDKFCNKCGTSYVYGSCQKCGNPVALSDKFCTKCGTRVGSEYKVQKPKNKEMSKIKLVTIIALAIVVFAFVMGGNKPINFNKQYGEYKDEVWCDISENGKEMRIDTNVNNLTDYQNATAVAVVKDVLDDIGFDDWHINTVVNYDSDSTTVKKNGYTVIWTNDSEQGLEIAFIKE